MQALFPEALDFKDVSIKLGDSSGALAEDDEHKV